MNKYFREAYPELLHRKDRGRPTEHQASIVPLKYGEIRAPDYVPGAEVLIKKLGNEVSDYLRDTKVTFYLSQIQLKINKALSKLFFRV